jgi:hypothetical protein
MRYLLGLNSNFFVFSDLGWSNNNIVRQSNRYIGAALDCHFKQKEDFLILVMRPERETI